MSSYSMLPIEQQNCRNCLYARDFTYWDGRKTLQCRHHAPSPADREGVAIWPTVKPDDWCGEWVSIAEVEPMALVAEVAA